MAKFLFASQGSQSCARRAFAACEASGLLNGLPEQQADAVVSAVLAGLVESGAEVDLHDAFLLSAAAKAGYARALQQLLATLRFGPSAFALSRALTAAAQNGHARAVEVLLRAGSPAAAYNHAALQAAAQGGNSEVVYRLCAAGADPTADGGAALRAAVSGGHTAAVRVLLQYGADPRARCSAALLHACELPAALSTATTTPAAAAVEAPAALSSPSVPPTPRLPTSTGLPPPESCVPSRFRAAAAYADGGCDSPVARTPSGTASDCVSPFAESFGPLSKPTAPRVPPTSSYRPYRPSEVATSCQQRSNGRSEEDIVELVSLLLAAGADARAHGRASLEAAAARGYERVVRLLLRAGADPAACNSCALVAASVQGHEGVVGLLLESGADPWDVSTLAMMTASERGFAPVVEMLRAAAASRKPAAGNTGHSTQDSNVQSAAFALGRGSSGERVCRSMGGNATAEALALAMALASHGGGGGPPEVLTSGTGHARYLAPVIGGGVSGGFLTNAGQQHLSGAHASASPAGAIVGHAAYACSGRRPLPLRAAKSSRQWNLCDPSRSPISASSHAAVAASQGHGHGHGAVGGASGHGTTGVGGSGARGSVAALAGPGGWRRHATDSLGSPAAGSPSQSASTNIVSTTQYGGGSTVMMMSTMATAYSSVTQPAAGGAAASLHSGAALACGGTGKEVGGGWPVRCVGGAGAVPVGLALGQGVVLGPSIQEAFRSFS